MAEGYGEEGELSVDQLMARRAALEETIQKVKRFPDEVSRACNIPLSGVASISGRFVRTNEFTVPGDDQEVDRDSSSRLVGLVSESWQQSFVETDKVSHKEAEKILRSRLEEVNDCLGGGAKGKTQINAPKETQPVEELNVLEIREFVDADGNEMRSEVVDMEKEMGGIGDVFEEMKKKKVGGAGGEASDENGSQTEVFAALEKKMQEFDLAAQGRAHAATSMDSETAFAYEMHATSNSSAVVPPANGDDLGFLEELETQEEHEKKRNKDDSGFGSGFKAGFLSAPAGGKKKSPTKQPVKMKSGPPRAPSALQDSVVERM